MATKYARFGAPRVCECCFDSAATCAVYVACTLGCALFLVSAAVVAVSFVPMPGTTDVPDSLDHLNRADLASVRYHLIQGDFFIWNPPPPPAFPPPPF